MLIGTPAVGEMWMVRGVCEEHLHLGSDYIRPFVWPADACPCPNCRYEKIVKVTERPSRTITF